MAMKQVLVLGVGCPKCIKLAQNVELVVKELGADWSVEKVSDMGRIVGFGVLSVPALVIDGEVKSVGQALSAPELRVLLSG